MGREVENGGVSIDCCVDGERVERGERRMIEYVGKQSSKEGWMVGAIGKGVLRRVTEDRYEKRNVSNQVLGRWGEQRMIEYHGITWFGNGWRG